MTSLNTILAAGLVFCTIGGAALQAKAEQIGQGRLFVNDIFGDGQDRWRSGSIIGSHLYGQEWQGDHPEGFGDIIEMRIMGQVIAPENLETPGADDRPYAGALSIGAHTHFERSGFDFAVGADATVVGPSTGLAYLQEAIHDLVGMAPPSDAVVDGQIGNKVTLTGVAEAGYIVELSEGARIRPFVEARAGDETLLRAGFDLTLGQFGHDELLVRDPVSGQRYQTTYQGRTGWSFLAGADFTVVDSSIYLPSSSGVTLEDTRERYRLGVNWQGEKSSVYYGATWLSREFVEQDEGQVVGAVRFRFSF